MPLYANIDGVKREVKELYANIGGAKKMLSEMNGNIDGAKKKIFSRYYTWAKYVSERYATYYPWTCQDTISKEYVRIFPPDSIITEGRAGMWDVVYNNDTNNTEYYLIIGDGYRYNSTYGIYTLTNKTTYRVAYTDSDGTSFGISNYAIETNLIGKYVVHASDCYEIIDHDDTDLLILGNRRYADDPQYKYRYVYKEDVTSTDPNAYTSGSTDNYESSSPSDIRTVYVRK